MKKIIYLIVLILGFSGCSVESYDSNEELITADARPTVQNVEESLVFGDLCAGEEAEFCLNFPQATIGNGNPKTTNVQVQLLKYGDDPETEEIEPEDYEYYEQIFHTSENTQACFFYTFDEANTYDLRYFIGSGGHTDVQAEVLDCSECEESFSYMDNNDGSYTFTYVPAEDMENAEIIFTLAQSVVSLWGESSVTTEWSTAGQTEHAFLDLEACETYWWTVSLEKDCNGSTPNNNVWTDFKVNDVSKKNELTPNITQSCED
ncbi:hypothetical protein NE848_01940 [Gramella jeungdoensis]|uniref:Lipoprotein n=1 Tax=Gramella jeungdoensis TaxID=708091 RepID=A0ABT0YXC1_9FLAO|nr:hypothetical protein [Gramella jeungdoensis]MCM8568118.1 hypothetical protein [Gramella jeungdoensis]